MFELSGSRMGDSPQDSIMDWSNNEEGLYNDKMSLFDRWVEEGDSWDERRALNEARRLAAHFAEAIESTQEGKYTEREKREAADEMMEEFQEYREEAIKAAVEEIQRTPEPERPMTEGEKEHAEKYEALAQEIGVDRIRDLIPASPEKVRKALARGDRHLNSISLRKWDTAAINLPTSGKRLSLSEKVCVLKHVATWHYA